MSVFFFKQNLGKGRLKKFFLGGLCFFFENFFQLQNIIEFVFLDTFLKKIVTRISFQKIGVLNIKKEVVFVSQTSSSKKEGRRRDTLGLLFKEKTQGRLKKGFFGLGFFILEGK